MGNHEKCMMLDADKMSRVSHSSQAVVWGPALLDNNHGFYLIFKIKKGKN